MDSWPLSPPTHLEALRTSTHRRVRDRPGADQGPPPPFLCVGSGHGGVLRACVRARVRALVLGHPPSSHLQAPYVPSCQGTERRGSPRRNLSRARLWDSRKWRRVDRSDSAQFWSHPKRNFCHLQWPRGGPGCSKGQGMSHLNRFASRGQTRTFLSFAVPSKPMSWHGAFPPPCS